jgi:SOS-response transcriptional repressor LexA
MSRWKPDLDLVLVGRRHFIEAREYACLLQVQVDENERLAFIDITRIPFLGRIAAGLAVDALHASGDRIAVLAPLLAGNTGNHFALRVDGDSMVRHGIFHGDIVVIRRDVPPQDGQIAVASAGGGATLKRVRRRGNTVTLESRNARYPARDFRIDAVTLQGTLVALMRCYQPAAAEGFGSRERLNVRTRCGSSWCASQIRCTERSEMPAAAAMARPVQCVASPGGLAQVSATTRVTVSAGIGRVPAADSRSSDTYLLSIKRPIDRHARHGGGRVGRGIMARQGRNATHAIKRRYPMILSNNRRHFQRHPRRATWLLHHRGQLSGKVDRIAELLAAPNLDGVSLPASAALLQRHPDLVLSVRRGNQPLRSTLFVGQHSTAPWRQFADCSA